MALPTKPSHTTTSMSPPLPRPARMSRPSTFPTYRSPGVCFSSWCASLTTALPFSSSSPTFNNPTPGLGRPITSRAYTEPKWAKPTSSRASQSTFAPPSMTSTGRPAVGNAVPMAARATPSCTRNSRVAAAMTAPVLPAEMNASDCPFFCRPRPTAMEERGLLLMAASGFSPMPTTSGASTMSSRLRSTSPCVWSAASTSAVRPTSWMRNVGGNSRSACTTPSTSTRGALSPPIASSAMRITSVLDRHPLLAAVVAAGGAHVVRPLQVAAARARLERDVRRLVVGAAGALLSFGGPSLGYGHGIVLGSVAGLAFGGGEGLPAGIAGRRTAAGARIQVLAAARAQPAAVLAAHYPLRHRQQQLLSHGGAQVDLRRVPRQGVAVRVLQGVGILRKQRANVGGHGHGDGDETAPALPRHLRAQGRLPVEAPLSRRVQPAGHPHRPGQDQPESLEQGVSRSELRLRGCGTAGQLPQVDLQHRRAKLNRCGT